MTHLLAEWFLRRAVPLQPESACARNALGTTRIRLGRAGEAKDRLRQASLVVSCACAALIASPAGAAAQQAVFVEAFFEFAAAIEGTFGDEGPHVGAALDRMAGALEEWDRRIQTFEARVTSGPAASGMRAALGRMYAERGRLADAQRELDAVSRLEPERPDVHVFRGLVLEAWGKPAEAGEAFRAAWTLDPSDPVKAYQVFRHAVRTGSATDAQRVRAALTAAYAALLADGTRATHPSFPLLGPFQARAGGPPVLPLAAYARGYALMSRGDYAGAIAEFRRAAATDPLVRDPAAGSPAVRQAAAALRQGRLAEAGSLLDGAKALRRSSEAHRISGLIYWADSEYDKSIEQLSAAVAERPRDERSRLALARVLSSAGRYVEAERALQETTELLPGSGLAWWWLGVAHEQLNRFADARVAFERAAATALTGHSQLNASIGRLAGTAGDFKGAVEAFTRSVSGNPNDPAMHHRLAGALQQLDRREEALVELVAALLLDPRDADAHARIGQIHVDAGRLGEAAGALRRAIELSPSHVEARYALATTLMRLGNTREADQEFTRIEQAQRQLLAERRRSMSVDVLKEEAALRAAEGRHDRAAALWERVIELEPGRASNHLGLARALAEGGQTDAAIARYETAVAMGAEPGAYRQLAELYERVGRRLDAARARALYEKAMREDRITAQ